MIRVTGKVSFPKPLDLNKQGKTTADIFYYFQYEGDSNFSAVSEEKNKFEKCKKQRK